jgi:hypothetical protein
MMRFRSTLKNARSGFSDGATREGVAVIRGVDRFDALTSGY